MKPALSPAPEKNDIDYAQMLIRAEADGLLKLADSLDDSFIKAVDLINTMRNEKSGRLIVSGVGKSGHVANKMVATLASTGVPAHYVHPSEASHGDLGMVTQRDVLILISNSGESSEQNDLIAYSRRFGIPLIAITRKPQSTLGRAADVTLLLPDVPEAFSDVVAPTTSTMNTMALGDALAEALMKRIGLTPEQFRVFHPGGKLGAQLQKVSDLMIKGDDVPFVTPDDTMDHVVLVMTSKNVGGAVVANADHTLLGIITDGDLKRHMSPVLLTQKARDIMTVSPQTIHPEEWAATAMSRMVQGGQGHIITSLVVVDDQNQVHGIIRVQECLAAGLM